MQVHRVDPLVIRDHFHRVNHVQEDWIDSFGEFWAHAFVVGTANKANSKIARLSR